MDVCVEYVCVCWIEWACVLNVCVYVGSNGCVLNVWYCVMIDDNV